MATEVYYTGRKRLKYKVIQVVGFQFSGTELKNLPGSWLVEGSDASSLCCPVDSMSVWLSKDDSIPGLKTKNKQD